jgi:hypothetical protein
MARRSAGGRGAGRRVLALVRQQKTDLFVNRKSRDHVTEF